jgi:hypothetical protein
MGQLAGIGMIFGVGIFGDTIQRRGAHVNILEIGSRGDVKCFGGI